MRTGNPWAPTAESLRALEHGRLVGSAKAGSQLGYVSRPIEETMADNCQWFEAARAM